MTTHRVYTEMEYSLKNGAYLVMYYSIKMGNTLVMYYGDCSTLRSSLNMYYGDCPDVRHSLQMPYGDLLALRHVLEMPYTLLASLLAYVEMPYSIADVRHTPYVEMPYDMMVNNPLRVGVEMPYMIQADGSTSSISATVTIGGNAVNPHHINIEAGLDEDCISAELHLDKESEYVSITRGDALIITVNIGGDTDVYTLIVESKRRQRPEVAKVDYIITGLSPAVQLSSPWSSKLLQEFSAGTAEDIINTLAGSYGPVDYLTVDFPILDDTLAANDETALEVIKTITESAGAIVQSDPDGTIRIAPFYPNNIPDWATATPDFYLTDANNFVSQDETPLHNTGENRYLIGNQLSTDDRLWTEQRSINGIVKEVLGFQTPWDNTLEPTLDHSGGAWVNTPEYLGVTEETYPPEDEDAEQVEFVAGYANSQRPMYGDTEINWLEEDLGLVSYTEEGQLEAGTKTGTTDGYSLAEIRYTTKFHLWRVTDDVNESVQFYIRVSE